MFVRIVNNLTTPSDKKKDLPGFLSLLQNYLIYLFIDWFIDLLIYWIIDLLVHVLHIIEKEKLQISQKKFFFYENQKLTPTQLYVRTPIKLLPFQLLLLVAFVKISHWFTATQFSFYGDKWDIDEPYLCSNASASNGLWALCNYFGFW